MGYRIELWTEHEDNGAAIHALATRVGDDSLTLTSGEDVPEGEWVAFEVKLADGTVFLEGMGRCQGSVANDPLWDVHLGMLQLETRDQMLFERIQLAAEDLAQGTRPTGEVDISELEKKAAAQKTEQKAPPPLPRPPAPPTPPTPATPATPPTPPTPPTPAKIAKPEPPRDDAAKKKKWPWQKTTEPGMPSPDPVEPPKAAKPPPPVSKPPPPVSKPPPPVSPPASKPASPVSKPSMDAPLSPKMRQRLMNLVPSLVAEGRVRDLAGAHELALQIGLQALETYLEDED